MILAFRNSALPTTLPNKKWIENWDVFQLHEQGVNLSESQKSLITIEKTATERDFNFNGKFGRQKSSHGVVNEEPIEEEINEGMEDVAPVVEE